MNENLNKYQRENAYATRQGQVFLTGLPSHGYGVRPADITEIGFSEAHDYESQTMNLSGRGPLMGPKKKNHAEDQFHFPGFGATRGNLDTRLRLMSRADATKLRAIDARMKALQKQRRAHVDAAFLRADVIDQPSLLIAIEKRHSDEKRGYPTNAVPKRVRGHRREAATK